MTRITAKDAQALLGQKRSKHGNKPVWECESCGLIGPAANDKFIYQKGRPIKCSTCQSALLYFASNKEWRRWRELKALEQAGQIRNLRRQVSYRLEVNGKLICKYIADAVYKEKWGWEMVGNFIPGVDRQYGPDQWQFVVEDSKGHATAVYKLKAKLMAAGACPEFPQGVEIRET